MIHCIPIPTPFLVGRVNLYLVEDEPLTLVDTGPNSGKALDELEQVLSSLGRRIEDIERLVITHQHIDHMGLADIIARRSGAEVCALDLLAPLLADYGADAERDDELAEALMLRHGIPRDVVIALRSMSRAFRAWGASVEVDRPLADGETLGFADRSWSVHHRPGHSPSDTVFYDAARRELIGGDHLIKHISSVPLISRPLGGKSGEPGDGRPRALATYLRSLSETREMDIETVLAGHGEPVHEHAALIDTRAHVPRAPRREDRRADRRAAALRLRDRAVDLGQRRRHAGVPDAQRGARPRRPAARARRGRGGSDGRRRPFQHARLARTADALAC